MSVASGTSMAVTDTDMAWLAAMLDFKGRFGVNRAQTTASGTQVRIRMVSSNEGVVRAMCEMTGLDPTRPKEFGTTKERRQCTRHCPEDHVHVITAKSLYFQVSGVAAAIVCYNLAPYLRVQKEKALEIYDVYMRTDGGSARGRYRTKSAAERLRALGWRIPPELEP
jgi:hypothetical protein